VVKFFTDLPGKVWNLLTGVISKITSWASNLVSKAKAAGSDFFNGLIKFFTDLPGKVWGFLVDVVNKVVNFGSNAVQKAKDAAKKIFNGIVDGIKNLPSKIASVGSDLVKGLWNGISNMVSWVTDKIKSFGDSILGGIKSFFGIHSPSRVFRDEVGKMLAVGLAEGIEENADQPLDAMTDLSKDLLGEADTLNGLTLERQLQHTFAAPEGFSQAESGMMTRLDRILAAIERGQILTIDGDKLVGATASQMDAALGRRRVLAARGAI
jgi:phage-related protein